MQSYFFNLLNSNLKFYYLKNSSLIWGTWLLKMTPYICEFFSSVFWRVKVCVDQSRWSKLVKYEEAGAVVVHVPLHGRSQNAQNSLIGCLKLSYVVSAPHLPHSLSLSLSLILARKPFSFFFFFLSLQLSQICNCKILSKCKGSNSYQWNYDEPVWTLIASSLSFIVFCCFQPMLKNFYSMLKRVSHIGLL